MKKKLLIGMAVIGASVAVLGGCGGSSENATTEGTSITETTSSETVSTAQGNASPNDKSTIQYQIEQNSFSKDGVKLTFVTVNFNSDWEKLSEEEKVNITLQALRKVKDEVKADDYMVNGCNTDLPVSEGTIFMWTPGLRETLYLYDKGESKYVKLSEEQLADYGL